MAASLLRVPARRLMQWLRRSLTARALVVSLVLSTLTTLLVFGLISLRISTELFKSRSETVVGLSQSAIEDVRSIGLGSTAQDEQSLQTLKVSMLRSAESLALSQQVALLKTESGERPVLNSPDLISASLNAQSIPASLREQVQANPDTIFWQSAKGASGEPAIVVGGSFSVPLAGEHEIYIENSLAPEQQTLEFVQLMLLIAALVLVLMTGAIAVIVTSLILRPIRRTVQVSSRLARGDLGQRLPQTGAAEAVALGRSFNKMADSLERQILELRRLSTLQRRFVSDVSHELRTPITTISLAADVIYARRDDLEGATRRSAEILHTQVQRFERLLSELLETSRLDAGVVALDRSEVDLVGLVRSVVTDCEALSQRQGSPITVTAPDGAVPASIDSVRVGRAVRNLLSNALEHGAGSPIEVVVDRPSGATPAVGRIRVVDHGRGISADDLEHVFDRFWRADASRQRTLGGTGLGLSITREDMQLHGGSVSAESELGHGATFTITLPLEEESS